MNKPADTEASVSAAKPSLRFLYGLGVAMRMRAINVRDELIRIVLERNGFTAAESTVISDQVRDRWNRMTISDQRRMRTKVELKQTVRSLRR